MTAVAQERVAARVRDVAENSLRPSTRPRGGLISLASGEPDFPTPAHITEALHQALRDGETHYAAWNGEPDLREAAAEALSRGARTPRAADEVIITHGGSAALTSAMLALVEAGDRVVIPSPTYSLYADLVRLAGGTPHFVPTTSTFQLDLDAIAAAAPGARMLVLCNPCNPTGAVYRRDELEAVAAIAEEHDLLVVSDEAYEHLVFDQPFTSALDVPQLAHRLLYAQTLSKTYAMTGWRVGYLAGPRRLVDAAALVHRTLTGPLNTAVQRAAVAALTGDQTAVATMADEYAVRRAIVLGRMAGKVRFAAPAGTFYAFLPHSRTLSSVAFVQEARERGLALRPGSEFGPGGEFHVRLSFATSREKLRAGLDILVPLLEELGPDQD
jgi:aspartate aminotransferase